MHDLGAHTAAPFEDVPAIAAPLQTPARGAALEGEGDDDASSAVQRPACSPGQGSDVPCFFLGDLERPQPRRTRSDSDLAKVVLSPAAEYAGRVQIGAHVRTSRTNSSQLAGSDGDGFSGLVPGSDLASPPELLREDRFPPPTSSRKLRRSFEICTNDAVGAVTACDLRNVPADVHTTARLAYTFEPRSSVRQRCSPSTVSSKDGKIDDEKVADSLLDATGLDEDSPYPEVRASVSNEDDPDALVVTFRVLVLGTFFCVFNSAANFYLSMRYPSVLIAPLLVQMAAYPLGTGLAKALPRGVYSTPRLFGYLGCPDRFSLNPGPFSIKEHALLTVMVNVATVPSLASIYSLSAETGYGVKSSLGFDVLLFLTTQTIGLGAAGLTRRFLIYPAAMIWPQDLVYSAILQTLHRDRIRGRPTSGQLRFFSVAVVGAFCWYWLPGFLFTALSAFSWICWIEPNNVVLNQLFGVVSGLGMGVVTLDWVQVTFATSPLITPWLAQVHVFVGFVLLFWIVTPALYYTNAFETSYLPIVGTAVWDRYGQHFNTSRVIDASGVRLDQSAYADYSPLFLGITLIVALAAQFALFTSVLTHTNLYHGAAILQQAKSRHTREDDDVHMRLMRNYKEVPDWWYGAFLIVALAASVGAIAISKADMPIWSLLLVIAYTALVFIPIAIIYATLSHTISFNMIIELAAGYVMPGRPLAIMLFKLYALGILYCGTYFLEGMKLAHYQKLPPRIVFGVQLLSTLLAALVQVATKRWLVATIPDLCTSNQPAGLSCPTVHGYTAASTIWGLIGPAHLFGPGKMYHSVLYWMIPGAVLPWATWYLRKRYPMSWLASQDVPAALIGSVFIPPLTGINYSSAFAVGFVFQYFLRRRRPEWWSKYNYLLSGGLDAGTSICGVVIFLALLLPKNGQFTLDWWGNSVYMKTADWLGTPYKTPPPEGFGPTSWS